MSEEGYLQNKLREQQEKIAALEQTNRVLQMDVQALSRNVNSLIENKQGKEAITVMIKTIEQKIVDDNKEIIKKDSLKMKETLTTAISEQITKELTEKMKEYDEICEKAARMTTQLMDNYQEKQLHLNEIVHKINVINNLLLYKKIVTKREIEMALKTYDKRKRYDIVK